MTLAREDIAEQQAEITRLLLHHIHAPLPGDAFIRGVLPPPPPTEAIRIVTGTESAGTPDELTVWEIPLRATDDPQGLIGGEEVLGILRALHTGTHIYPSDRIGMVMGMRLVHVDPGEISPAYGRPAPRRSRTAPATSAPTSSTRCTRRSGPASRRRTGRSRPAVCPGWARSRTPRTACASS
ncbi:hypothetical protein GCM10010365_39020 [Streptomyces poonensis]|uniref:Uncharacterized protein n=1 Tax=Streptomyces poonensis TaxID=68255 RepID=A0A918PMC0_9ACTN|nr:hypothetical protein GCM10010365_39020 [Streptomyces poonensis]GLJ91505.1 hypothetical protein GCM10017589_41120 [Streptomyces poonensis]